MSNPAYAAAVEQLEPKAVWRLFAGMAGVPRASKQEEKIRKHMLALAKELGFAAREDAVGNIGKSTAGDSAPSSGTKTSGR